MDHGVVEVGGVERRGGADEGVPVAGGGGKGEVGEEDAGVGEVAGGESGAEGEEELVGEIGAVAVVVAVEEDLGVDLAEAVRGVAALEEAEQFGSVAHRRRLRSRSCCCVTFFF